MKNELLGGILAVSIYLIALIPSIDAQTVDVTGYDTLVTFGPNAPAVSLGSQPNAAEEVIVSCSADDPSLVTVRSNGEFDRVNHSILPSSVSYAAATADMDNDGDLDIIIGATNDGFLLMENDGEANFPSSTMLVSHANTVKFLAVGDLDGDGDLDIVATDDQSTNALKWYRHDSHSSLYTFQEIIIMDVDCPGQVAIYDIDKDGDNDIMAACQTSVFILENDGATNPTFSTYYTTSVADGKGVAVGDIDGDGLTDVVFTGEQTSFGEVIVLTNTGTTFTLTERNTDFLKPKGVALGSFWSSLDGQLELVLCDASDELYLIPNSGGSLDFSGAISLTTGQRKPYDALVEDFNGDGNYDILFVTDNGATKEDVILFGYGSHTFGSENQLRLESTNPGRGIASGDFDLDGNMDCVVGHGTISTDRVDVYIGVQRMTFTNTDWSNDQDLDYEAIGAGTPSITCNVTDVVNPGVYYKSISNTFSFTIEEPLYVIMTSQPVSASSVMLTAKNISGAATNDLLGITTGDCGSATMLATVALTGQDGSDVVLDLSTSLAGPSAVCICDATMHSGVCNAASNSHWITPWLGPVSIVTEVDFQFINSRLYDDSNTSIVFDSISPSITSFDKVAMVDVKYACNHQDAVPVASGSVVGLTWVVNMGGLRGHYRMCYCLDDLTKPCHDYDPYHWHAPPAGEIIFGRALSPVLGSSVLVDEGVNWVRLFSVTELTNVSFVDNINWGSGDMFAVSVDGCTSTVMRAVYFPEFGQDVSLFINLTATSTPLPDTIDTCVCDSSLHLAACDPSSIDYWQSLSTPLTKALAVKFPDGEYWYPSEQYTLLITTLEGLTLGDDSVGLLQADGSRCGQDVIDSSTVSLLPSDLNADWHIDTSSLSASSYYVCVCQLLASPSESVACDPTKPADWQDPSGGSQLLQPTMLITLNQTSIVFADSTDTVVLSVQSYVNLGSLDQIGITLNGTGCGTSQMLPVTHPIVNAIDGNSVSFDLSVYPAVDIRHVCLCSYNRTQGFGCDPALPQAWFSPRNDLLVAEMLFVEMAPDIAEYLAAPNQTVPINQSSYMGGMDGDRIGLSSAPCSAPTLTIVQVADQDFSLNMTATIAEYYVCYCYAFSSASGSCDPLVRSDWDVNRINPDLPSSLGRWIPQLTVTFVSNEGYFDQLGNHILQFDTFAGVLPDKDMLGFISSASGLCGVDPVNYTHFLNQTDVVVTLPSVTSPWTTCICSHSTTLDGVCSSSDINDWQPAGLVLYAGIPTTVTYSTPSGALPSTAEDFTITLTGSDTISTDPLADLVFLVANNTGSLVALPCDDLSLASTIVSNLGPGDGVQQSLAEAIITPSQPGLFYVCYRSNTFEINGETDNAFLLDMVSILPTKAEAVTISSTALQSLASYQVLTSEVGSDVGSRSYALSWSAGLSNDCVFSGWQVDSIDSAGLITSVTGCTSLTSRLTTSCVITGLIPNRIYNISVIEGCSDSQANSPASTLSFRTIEEPTITVPLAVTDLLVLTAYDFVVRWTSSSSNGGVSVSSSVFGADSVFALSTQVASSCNDPAYITPAVNDLSLSEVVGSATYDGVASFQFPSDGQFHLCYLVNSPVSWPDVSGFIIDFNTTVTVSPRPATPPSILSSFSTVSSTSIDLRWVAAASNDCVFSNWQVHSFNIGTGTYLSIASSSQCHYSQLDSRTATTCTLDGLTASTDYQISVTELCADNRTDASSAQVLFTTLDPVSIATPPTSVTLSAATATSIAVDWTAGSGNDCSFTNWQVQVVVASTGVAVSGHGCSSGLTTRSITSCVATYLSPSTSYYVNVREQCSNLAARSDFSLPSSSLSTSSFSDPNLSAAMSASQNITNNAAALASNPTLLQSSVSSALSALTLSESSVSSSSSSDPEVESYAQSTRASVREDILSVLNQVSSQDFNIVVEMLQQVTDKSDEVTSVSQTLAVSALDSQLDLIIADATATSTSLNLTKAIQVSSNLLSANRDAFSSLQASSSSSGDDDDDDDDSTDYDYEISKQALNKALDEIQKVAFKTVSASLDIEAGGDTTADIEVGVATDNDIVSGRSAPASSLLDSSVTHTFSSDVVASLSGAAPTFSLPSINAVDSSKSVSYIASFRDSSINYDGETYDQENLQVTNQIGVSGVFSLSIYQDNTEVEVSLVTDPIVISIPTDPLPSDEYVRQCRWWETDLQVWLTVGCTLNDELSSSTLAVCECTHLTDFQIGAAIPSFNTLSTSDLSATFDADNITKNSNTVAIISCFLFFFGVAYAWSHRIDTQIAHMTQQEKYAEHIALLRGGEEANQSFCQKFWLSIKNNHNWLSIVYRDPTSSYLSADRVVSLSCTVFAGIFAAAVLYSSNSSIQIVGKVLIAASFSLINNLIFKKLFLRVKDDPAEQKKYVADAVEMQPKSVQAWNDSADEAGITIHEDNKNAADAAREKNDLDDYQAERARLRATQCLPPCTRKVLHVVGIVWTIVAAFLIVTLAIKFSNETEDDGELSESNEWMMVSLLSLLQQVFVNQQLVILVSLVGRSLSHILPTCLLKLLD